MSAEVSHGLGGAVRPAPGLHRPQDRPWAAGALVAGRDHPRLDGGGGRRRRLGPPRDPARGRRGPALRRLPRRRHGAGRPGADRLGLDARARRLARLLAALDPRPALPADRPRDPEAAAPRGDLDHRRAGLRAAAGLDEEGGRRPSRVRRRRDLDLGEPPGRRQGPRGHPGAVDRAGPRLAAAADDLGRDPDARLPRAEGPGGVRAQPARHLRHELPGEPGDALMKRSLALAAALASAAPPCTPPPSAPTPPPFSPALYLPEAPPDRGPRQAPQAPAAGPAPEPRP